MYAVENEREASIKALIDNGADPNHEIQVGAGVGSGDEGGVWWQE